MESLHRFELRLDWSLAANEVVPVQNRISRNHTVTIEGKLPLDVSAAKAFKGDGSLYNPEDLLLSSLASCHMMSYFYCCSQEGIMVKSYYDNAEALLMVSGDGSGRIVKVILRPVVIIENKNQLDLAKDLHVKANKLCFIANSCNFPIEHHAEILVK